jgi:transposase
MSDTFSRVEEITGVARRRRFTTEQKLAVVTETMQPGMSISNVARRHGLSPSLVLRWRRLMADGGREAVRADDDVVATAEARRLEVRVRELERQLGCRTLEVEILKRRWSGRAQSRSYGRALRCRTFPNESRHRYA